jgi:hypothetical protein
VIDFRYHLVSIVAVFLALAIGIVFGSTELQGNTIDVLRSANNALSSQANAAERQRDSNGRQAGAAAAFLATAEPRLVGKLLAGDRLVVITEPGASSTVTEGVKIAAREAGATVTGTVALQPKFNDLSGTTAANLSTVNSTQATAVGTQLNAAADPRTANQQQAAQLIAGAVVSKNAAAPGLSAVDVSTLLQAYAQAGYLTYSGSPGDRATLAVIVIPETPPADAGDPANEILLAVAQEFAGASAATVVAGSTDGSAASTSALTVLRSSSVSSQVSTVDNADGPLGQIAAIWALADQVAGGNPNSYGISGASAVSPALPSVPSASPSASPSVTSSAQNSKQTANTARARMVRR